jgi:hypothetical protein
MKRWPRRHPRRPTRGRPDFRSYWLVFLVVCCFLGLLVFVTVLHMIGTDTRKARIIRAPTLIGSPVISEAHKREHTKLAHKLGISHVIGWIGPHLLEDLPDYLALANVTLLSRPDCPGTQSSY